LNTNLRDLYEATSDDLFFAIGLVQGDDDGREESAAPTITITYPQWTRRLLEMVRGTFCDGVTLTVSETHGEARHIYLATRQRVTVGLQYGGETDVLRGPAWNARLERIDRLIVDVFENTRRRSGRFYLLLRGDTWGFGMSVYDDGHACVGDVMRVPTLPIV